MTTDAEVRYGIYGTGDLAARDFVQSMLESKGFKIEGSGMGGCDWDLEVHTDYPFFERKMKTWAPHVEVRPKP